MHLYRFLVYHSIYLIEMKKICHYLMTSELLNQKILPNNLIFFFFYAIIFLFETSEELTRF